MGVSRTGTLQVLLKGGFCGRCGDALDVLRAGWRDPVLLSCDLAEALTHAEKSCGVFLQRRLGILKSKKTKTAQRTQQGALHTLWSTLLKLATFC